jgi:hypothetical protein
VKNHLDHDPLPYLRMSEPSEQIWCSTPRDTSERKNAGNQTLELVRLDARRPSWPKIQSTNHAI